MYIGSITKYIKDYRFCRRGTSAEFPPAEQLGEGSVFEGGSVGFAQLSMLNVGFDLHITLRENCFIDRLILGESEGFGAVELFVPNGAGLKCVAKAGKEDPVAGVFSDKLIVRFHGNYLPVKLSGLDLFGAVYEELNLYPQPAQFAFDAGEGFRLADAEAIYCDKNDADLLFAAEYFAQRVERDLGLSLEVRQAAETAAPAVRFCKNGAMAAENYRVQASAQGVSAAASDRTGLLYAAVTIMNAAKGGFIPAITVEDKPYMQLRGAHFGLPARDKIDFFKRLIRELLIPMHYNTIFMEIAAGMEFESHPEINEMWNKVQDDFEKGIGPRGPHGEIVAGGRTLTKAEVRDIVDYAESFGIEVIPEIQSLSHVQYITMSHPELGEVAHQELNQDAADEFAKADIRPEQVHAHCFCAADDRCYDLIFELADEILDVFKPKRYVHMGHDEVYEIGVCDRCRDRDPAELFATDVNKFHDYLAKRGLKMMIWGDMLQNFTAYKTPPAIDMIPKDIILLDFIWYFDFDRDTETYLLNNGFQIVIGNLYSSHFPRYAKRIAQPGILGGQVSMWVADEEYRLATQGKLYDLLYTAGMLWTPDYHEEARLCYDRIVRGLIPALRENLRGESERYASTTELLGGKAPVEVVSPDAVSALPRSAELPVGEYFDALAFTQTCDRECARISWQKMLPVGEYRVNYEDGTQELVPIEYGAAIRASSVRYADPLKPPYYRHEGYTATYLADPISGKTADGQDFTLYRYQWKNPHPRKKIISVTLCGVGDTDAVVQLYRLEGLK